MQRACNIIRLGFTFILLATLFIGIGAHAASTMRVSLPPVMASLPVAFAEEWGLFDAHGVDVEIIGVTDAQVRSTALSTGDLDFVIEDVTQFVFDLQSGQQLIATSASYSTPQTNSMQLGLISPGSFRLDSIDDLVAANYLVGTMYASDHEYMLDQLFEATLTDGQEKPSYTYYTDVLFLATWFGAQALPAVVLPEPHISYLATYTPASGAKVEVVVLSDFSEIEMLPSLFVFRETYAEENPDAIAAFYAAYKEAVDRVNATSRAELLETGLEVVLPLFFQGADPTLIGQDVLDAIPIPTFEQPRELPEEQYTSVLDWMEDRGYALIRPVYEEIFDITCLP